MSITEKLEGAATTYANTESIIEGRKVNSMTSEHIKNYKFKTRLGIYCK